MAKRTFRVEMTVYADVEFDDKVIKAVDDDWRKSFYRDIDSPEKIAEHIAYNALINDWSLSKLDGFANLPDDLAEVSADDFEYETVETTPRPKARRPRKGKGSAHG